MRLVLAVLVLCACGGAPPVAIANRGDAASTSCRLPARMVFEARRYEVVDADDPAYHAWTPWRVGVHAYHPWLAWRRDGQLRATRGTLAMAGDNLRWTFDVSGRLDSRSCVLELFTPYEHEGFRVTIDLAARTGRIRSIDHEWLLGPPFPATR